MKAVESARERSSYWGSLGFSVKDDGARIGDVLAGSPADMAGLASGGKLVAVDGRKYTKEVMADALKRAKIGAAPIELLVDSDDLYRTVKVDWHGGERYPALERTPGKPDLLAAILSPRVVKLGGAK